MEYSKGQVLHRTKKSAERVAAHCRAVNIPYKITKLKSGYRVDKNWS